MEKKHNFFLNVKRIPVFYANKKDSRCFFKKAGFFRQHRENCFICGKKANFFGENWTSIFSEKSLCSNLNLPSILKKRTRNLMEDRSHRIMVAQFDQITFVCEKCNTFQDSKLIFMISDFYIFPIMFFRQLNCGV